MEKEFVPYELALRMKALGFDEPCFGYYDGNHNLQFMYNGYPEKFSKKMMGVSDSVWVGWISAPTFSQAFRWFREKYDMAHQVTYAGAKGRYNAFTDDWVYDSNGELKEFSYEEAELACLDKLIEIVESKQRINRIIKDVQDGK